MGFQIPACEEPPDPEEDLNADADVNSNIDDHHISNDINERNCETPPAGFNGDIVENQSVEYLRENLDVDDDKEDAVIDDENNEEEKKKRVKRILNDGGNNAVCSLEELFSHIRNKNLPLVSRKLVSSDGNCFFESCTDLADKFDINVPRDKMLLRQLLVDSMKEHPEYPVWLEICCEGDIEAFDMAAEELRKDGTYTDASGMIVMTAARVLGNDFCLYKTRRNIFGSNCLRKCALDI